MTPNTPTQASESACKNDSGQRRTEAVDESDPDRRADSLPPEVGGRKGPEPTRYGDWEKNGRCIDF